MSKAPPSPSFRPPSNARLKGSLPKIGSLTISTSPNNTSEPHKDEISPVELEPPAIVIEPESVTNNSARRNSGHIELRITPPETTRRRNSQAPDDDIYALDD